MTLPEPSPLRVTVWGENVHERRDEQVRAIYPDGMHTVVADAIREHLGDAVVVRTATLEEPENGLTEEVLASTDVLTWWGHAAHDDVSDAVAQRVQEHVLSGMGLIALHSAHFAKPFKLLMGTSCRLRWRNDHDRELIWTVDPTHPIAAGVPQPLVNAEDEMYGEHFDVPAPDELVFVSSFTGGEVFRSGGAWKRGHGKVFYFRPGDQDYPVYYQPGIRRVIANAVAWARPSRAERELPGIFRADVPAIEAAALELAATDGVASPA
ncbi:protein of unknown function DUF1037 [Beutenbergia cavernae DSM 12333]|uniref:ThuA-like domain-containing protein n=1 Tax=Beutenbergia cavernae (strain ATCC BAA-8 / DSM 12333 / CCUG 43141 / JCM 11478 / NBRC 16432 / NCIMB 13614 / HKI 0122) TaxID=471853 RepID=C5C101_BEUC1|nr:trehalose utilization protein ThuA [Beutenbergia cavernae]ACQ79405.1 protein of unknown function DUF1037 [Beutenbergia cavernae DSM 12333]